MANIRAIASGNWSNNAIWSPAPPTSVDDVFASGFTITVDQNIQVLSINTIGATGIGGGGSFRPNNGVVMTTNVVAGSTICVNFTLASPNSFSLVGNVSAGNASNAYGINNNTTGTINVTGNIVAGSTFNTYGINNGAGGTVTILGNVQGSLTAPNNTGAYGVMNFSTGTINVIGNCLGGVNQGTHAVVNATTGAVNITGFCIGSRFLNSTGLTHGLLNNGAGPITVVGGCYGGSSSSSLGLGNASTGNVTVYGVVSGYSGGNSQGITNSVGGVINIIGTIYGGQGTSVPGVVNSSTGTINVTGNCFGYDISRADFSQPINGTGGYAIHNVSTGLVMVSGNVYSSNTRGDAWGIYNQAGGTVVINGDVYGGNPGDRTDADGVRNNSTGTVLISGSAIGGRGVTAYGARNVSTGILRVKRAVGNDWGLGYTTALASVPGVFSAAQGSQTFVEELQLGPRGQWPTGGVIFFTPNTKAISMFETDTFQNYTLIQSNSADNLVPPVSSVRQNTTYNLNALTGTCIIPPISSVGSDVPVDNTVGIATLTPTGTWNISSVQITDNQSMGGRLKNTITANAAEKIVNSFN